MTRALFVATWAALLALAMLALLGAVALALDAVPDYASIPTWMQTRLIEVQS